MDRIAIIGCGGSGKSTVARQLARILDVPLVHLDTIYYDERWKPLPQNEFATLQEKLVTGERWIIEGNYAKTLPIRLAATDTVIFLDLYDRITWNFIRYILGYRRAMRPRVRDLVQQHGQHVRLITLTSRRQANHLINRVRASDQQAI